jgi:small conductance mechanosensitive channel
VDPELTATETVGRFVDWVKTEGPQWLATDGLAILITAIIALVALRLAAGLANRLTHLLQRGKQDIETKKRAETLSGVIRWVLRVAILIIAGMMILDKLGVQIGPIIAAAGIVGLAVGFGAQNLVQDVISGFFILLEDQVRVGDVVNLDGRGGLVERVTLRMTVLRDLAGVVHFVRNGQITVISNLTKDFSFYVFDIGVAYRENTDDVIKVVRAVDEEIRKDPEFQDDILAPMDIFGVDKFDSSAVIIKARIKTKPIQQWRIGREYNRRIKLRFDEVGIEIPFPHVTIYPGKDKQGQSPSLVVQLENEKLVPPQ